MGFFCFHLAIVGLVSICRRSLDDDDLNVNLIIMEMGIFINCLLVIYPIITLIRESRRLTADMERIQGFPEDILVCFDEYS